MADDMLPSSSSSPPKITVYGASSRPNCRRAKKFLISRFGSDFGLVWAGESVGESVGLIQEKELDSVGMGRNGPEWAGVWIAY